MLTPTNYLTKDQKTVNISLSPSSWVMLLALRVLLALNEWSASKINQLVENGEGENLPEIDDFDF
ncbi:MAG TPA: hypothetical protein VIQ31_16550 [Phormidium sp.]